MTKLAAHASHDAGATTGAAKGGGGGGGDVEQAIPGGCDGGDGVPVSTPSRLILPFAPTACCSGSQGTQPQRNTTGSVAYMHKHVSIPAKTAGMRCESE